MKGYFTREYLDRLRDHVAELQARPEPPKRMLQAVKVSEDHGATWKNRVLCGDCLKHMEPPTRVTRHGSTGARYCEFCGARNNGC